MKKTTLTQFTSLQEVHAYIAKVNAQEEAYIEKRNKMDAQIRNLKSQIEALKEQKEELFNYYERVSI